MPKLIVMYRSLDCIGFAKYRVGTDGSVWSCHAWSRNRRDGKLCETDGVWRRLSPGRHPKGHLMVNLIGDSGKKAFFIHQLVLRAFVGPCPEGMEVRHFPDRDPSNNSLYNLQYGTKEENERDRITHGTDNAGSRHGMSKLDENAVMEMRRLRQEGWTLSRLSVKFGVNVGNVSVIINRKAWKHLP